MGGWSGAGKMVRIFTCLNLKYFSFFFFLFPSFLLKKNGIVIWEFDLGDIWLDTLHALIQLWPLLG